MKKFLTILSRAIKEIDAGSFIKSSLPQHFINMTDQARSLLWNVIIGSGYNIDLHSRRLKMSKNKYSLINPMGFSKMIVVEDETYGDIIGHYISYDKENAVVSAREAINEAKSEGNFNPGWFSSYMEKRGFFEVTDLYRIEP